ncbi:DNA packaging protein UL32 [Cervid alphaherpesvirus 1]|uniref:Packaging protein UL32 n=1 Tax=Cervid alphaherpesvirus 1 TaxID=79891 RepID=A0A455JPX9_9ALPH|nr:DNA packaging protein UL32 [Cervid alphaherpesvirus 1]AVT50677.1 DNA packaging protein UL32 [Cervid alphaherpesvirus 1]
MSSRSRMFARADDGAAGGEGARSWAEGAFAAPYVAFDPALLKANGRLLEELVFAAHLMEVPGPRDDGDGSGDGGDAGDAGAADVAPFVEAAAAALAIDQPCAVCRAIDAYRREFGLAPPWVADYAMLCAKSLAAPPCAVAIVVAAFEFVYLMDRHFLAAHRATLVGAFAARALTLVDVHKHFFLHVCFRTDGGVPGGGGGAAEGPRRAAGKVRYSNYSFLIQSATRALLASVADRPEAPAGAAGAAALADGAGPRAPRPQSLATALLSWKECARLVDCSTAPPGGPRAARRPGGTCCDAARARAAEYEARAAPPPPAGPDGAAAPADRWAYADLALLLLAGVATRGDGEVAARAAASRRAAVGRYWAARAGFLAANTAPRFARFAAGDARPSAALGPVLATALKHIAGRGRTTGECVLCNLLLTPAHWRALRALRADVVAHSANNAGLFDCILPVLEARAGAPVEGDGGRFFAALALLEPEAVYKHLFCDPMCAACELQTDPKMLFAFSGDDARDAGELDLYKARVASENTFEGRVCAGLWALAYAFKTYQLFPPKPTACAAFVRDAGQLLRRHGVALVSLEHTLCHYV